MFYLIVCVMHYCTVEVKDEEKYKIYEWFEKGNDMHQPLLVQEDTQAV